MEDSDLMTDADFEYALNAFQTDDKNEISDLLRVMSETRIISWEDAERIMYDLGDEPIKSSLPQQTRPSEPDNDTDVDLSIRRLLQNDPQLVEINLNNMKRTPIPQIKRILEAIRQNTYLQKISLANMGLYDMDVAPLVNVLEDNESLRSINVETNYLSGEFFAKLLRAALKNQTLEEIKAVNQGVAFSTQAEREIINAVFENRNLTKVSINLRLPEGRHKIEQATIRNQEIRRILRRKAAAEARLAAEAAEALELKNQEDLQFKKITEIKLDKNLEKTQKKNFTNDIQNGLQNDHNNEKSTKLNQLEKKKTDKDNFESKFLIQKIKKELSEKEKNTKLIPPKILSAKSSVEKPQTLLILSENKKTPNTLILQKTLFDKKNQINDILPTENNNNKTISETIYVNSTKPIKNIIQQKILPQILKNNKEVKGAVYIPEAPLGKASAMAKKFAAAEAAARNEANRIKQKRLPDSTTIPPPKKIIEMSASPIIPFVVEDKKFFCDYKKEIKTNGNLTVPNSNKKIDEILDLNLSLDSNNVSETTKKKTRRVKRKSESKLLNITSKTSAFAENDAVLSKIFKDNNTVKNEIK